MPSSAREYTPREYTPAAAACEPPVYPTLPHPPPVAEEYYCAMSNQFAFLLDAAVGELRRNVAATEAAAAVLVEQLVAVRRIALYGVGREGLAMKGFAMRLHHMGLQVPSWVALHHSWHGWSAACMRGSRCLTHCPVRCANSQRLPTCCPPVCSPAPSTPSCGRHPWWGR